jgi:hypothetical protein
MSPPSFAGMSRKAAKERKPGLIRIEAVSCRRETDETRLGFSFWPACSQRLHEEKPRSLVRCDRGLDCRAQALGLGAGTSAGTGGIGVAGGVVSGTGSVGLGVAGTGVGCTGGPPSDGVGVGLTPVDDDWSEPIP